MPFQVNDAQQNLHFSGTNPNIRNAIKESIRYYTVSNVWVTGGQHRTTGDVRIRIDSDPTTGGGRKLQIQLDGTGNTYATVLIANTLQIQNAIQFHGLAFKQALEAAYERCQANHVNTTIVWN